MTMDFSDNFISGDGPLSPDEDNKLTVNSETLLQALEEVVGMFVEDEGVLMVAQMGRELRYGELEEIGVFDDVPEEFQVVNSPGMDIFGQPVTKTSKGNFECECPKCKRTLAAARFAQHLEKCMGMGRNSSRIASRRLAAASTSNNSNANANAEAKAASQANSASSSASQLNGDLGLGTDDEHFSDEDDEDWTMEKKKKTKKGAEKGTPK
ncbi:unnamed protein product, partial [Allacma fusca]